MAKVGKQPVRQEPRLDVPAESSAQAAAPRQAAQAPAGKAAHKPAGQKTAGQRRAGASLEPPPEIAARMRMPQIRLLPVLIFVLALMLSVRGNDFWTELSSISLTTASVAQQPPPPGRTGKTDKAAPPQTAQAPAPTPAPAAAPAPAPVAAVPSPAPIPAAPAAPVSDGEQSFTQNEIDLLQKLAERREGLDGRAKELDMREGLLRAAEGRIDKKIAEMQTLQGTIESLLKKYNEQEDMKMRSLVKIYENMKPKDAARIFEQLDMPILLGVVDGMKEQKFAPILAEMDPAKAKAVTSELAQRRQLPPPSTLTSGG